MSISEYRLCKPYFTHEINLPPLSDNFVPFQLPQYDMPQIGEHILLPGMLLWGYATDQFALFALLYGTAYVLDRSICQLGHFGCLDHPGISDRPHQEKAPISAENPPDYLVNVHKDYQPGSFLRGEIIISYLNLVEGPEEEKSPSARRALQPRGRRTLELGAQKHQVQLFFRMDSPSSWGSPVGFPKVGLINGYEVKRNCYAKFGLQTKDRPRKFFA
jgi:hypothetical protein